MGMGTGMVLPPWLPHLPHTMLQSLKSEGRPATGAATDTSCARSPMRSPMRSPRYPMRSAMRAARSGASPRPGVAHRWSWHAATAGVAQLDLGLALTEGGGSRERRERERRESGETGGIARAALERLGSGEAGFGDSNLGEAVLGDFISAEGAVPSRALPYLPHASLASAISAISAISLNDLSALAAAYRREIASGRSIWRHSRRDAISPSSGASCSLLKAPIWRG